MTESQINYFLAVAREKSISKASDALFVSQPAVSKQIALLETELGCKLFERHTRGLNLTSAGKAFEKLFLEFQLRFKETIETAHSSSNTLSGKYILGAFDGWLLDEYCLDLFSVLEKRYPLVEFEVNTYSIDQIIYALKRGDVNHVIATEALIKDHQDIVLDHICSISSLLLFSAADPLANKPDLQLSDFKDSIFYVTTPQNMSTSMSGFLRMCDDAGFIPHVESLPSLQAVYNKIQSSKGVFITNEWIMAKTNPIFKTLRLPYQVNVGFASLKGSESLLSMTLKKDILEFYKEKFKE